MSKVIRLTEGDLVSIVKRVIQEQQNVKYVDFQDKSTFKNAQTNPNTCPAGFVKMTPKEISVYDKQLVKPWASTTSGSDGYRVLQKGKVICKRVSSRASGDPVDVFKDKSLDEVVSDFRDLISGVGGTVAQIIVSGLGGHVANMVAWGLLVAYDIYSWVQKGTADWFNILHDLFCLLLSGVGGKIMGGYKSLIQGESKLATVFTKLSQTKSWGYIESVLSKISSYGGKIISKITEALKTITKTFTSLKGTLQPLMGILNLIGGVLTTIEKTLVEFTKLNVKKGTTAYIKSDIQDKLLMQPLDNLNKKNPLY